MFTVLLFQIKQHLLSTAFLNGFETPWELRNPLSKAIPWEFHGYNGHSKHNWSHNRVNILSLGHGKLSQFLKLMIHYLTTRREHNFLYYDIATLYRWYMQGNPGIRWRNPMRFVVALWIM